MKNSKEDCNLGSAAALKKFRDSNREQVCGIQWARFSRPATERHIFLLLLSEPSAIHHKIRAGKEGGYLAQGRLLLISLFMIAKRL